MSDESTPLIIGSNGFVVALDPLTGVEIWRTKLQSGILNATKWQDVTVLVHDGIVFAGSQGHLFGLSVADGSILWSNGLKGLGYNDVSLAVEGTSVQFVLKKQTRRED